MKAPCLKNPKLGLGLGLGLGLLVGWSTAALAQKALEKLRAFIWPLGKPLTWGVTCQAARPVHAPLLSSAPGALFTPRETIDCKGPVNGPLCPVMCLGLQRDRECLVSHDVYRLVAIQLVVSSCLLVSSLQAPESLLLCCPVLLQELCT
jgi:hypothetical protein